MEMIKRISIISLLAVLYFATSAFAVNYQLVDLGTLGGSYGYAYDINNSGQIVGYSGTASGMTHAFLYDDGIMTDLGTLGGNHSYANAINDSGQIVGYSYVNSSSQHAFLYQNDAMTDLGTLGGNYSQAYDINNNGEIIGLTQNATAQYRSFSYENGIMTDLTDLGVSASRINNDGQIAGVEDISGINHVMLYDTGSEIDRGLVPYYYLPYNATYITGINDAGQIIGYHETSTVGSGFSIAFLNLNGTFTNLGTLGGTSASAYAINNKGQIVGGSFVTGNSYYRAFLYENGVMRDLGTLGGISGAYGINDAGQIVGYSYTSTGERHAVLWNPVVVPEPISSILFVAGGTLLAGRRLLKRGRS